MPISDGIRKAAAAYIKNKKKRKPKEPMLSKVVRVNRVRLDAATALDGGTFSAGVRAALQTVAAASPAVSQAGETTFDEWLGATYPTGHAFWKHAGMFGDAIAFSVGCTVTEALYEKAVEIGGSFNRGVVLAIDFATRDRDKDAWLRT